MKRYFILTLFLIAALPSLLAQAGEVVEPIVDQPVEKQRYFNIGVTGGLDRNYHIIDMSYMGDYRYSKYAEGSSYGVQFGFTPLSWLSLRVEGVILQKNYNRSHVIGGTTTSLPDTTCNKYVNVPVMLMLNVGKKIRLHAYGGGYWGRWLESRRTGVTYGMNGPVSYSEEVDFDSPESQVRDNRTDIGLVWGGGISGMIKKRFEVGIEARWYYGLKDIQNDYMAQLNPRYNTTVVLQGGVSYWF